MARRAKIEDAESEDSQAEAGENIISTEDLLAALEEINTLKREAAEASGAAGKATQEAVKKFGCDAAALTFTARLGRMETTKRQAIVTNLIGFIITAGWLDEPDMFLRQQLADLVNRTDNSAAA